MCGAPKAAGSAVTTPAVVPAGSSITTCHAAGVGSPTRCPSTTCSGRSRWPTAFRNRRRFRRPARSRATRLSAAPATCCTAYSAQAQGNQRADHHQPDLRPMGQRIRPCEDDDGAARPADPSLPRRGSRQRVVPLSPQQHHGQVAHQRRASNPDERGTLPNVGQPVLLPCQGFRTDQVADSEASTHFVALVTSASSAVDLGLFAVLRTKMSGGNRLRPP